MNKYNKNWSDYNHDKKYQKNKAMRSLIKCFLILTIANLIYTIYIIYQSNF